MDFTERVLPAAAGSPGRIPAGGEHSWIQLIPTPPTFRSIANMVWVGTEPKRS